MTIILYLMAVLVIWLSFWSLIPHNAWWVRGADFPRIQLLFIGLVCLVSFAFFERLEVFDWVLIAMLGLALAYQLKMILPYTPLYPKQVKQLKPHELKKDHQISLLISNVLTPNPHHNKLLALINHHQPDIVLTLESDATWEASLSSIEKDYPYTAKVPLDNLYGMHFYSRLRLEDCEIKFLISEEIPSIHTKVVLPCGKRVWLHCLHPEPPSPTEADESTLRDAEILLVGKAVREMGDSCIVMGDLNDVAWSRTTRLFGRISGLLDPRIGRYFINTFHADYWFLRWSLDHIFHSADFALVEMQRLAHIGSDHFPVFTVLQYGGAFESIQEAPTKTQEDETLANEKIKDGLKKAEEDDIATPDSIDTKSE